MKLFMTVLAVLTGIVVASCVVETEPAPLPPRRPLPAPSASVATPPPAPPPPASADAGQVTTGPAPPDSYRTCAVDADCAAVLRNGCCHDGRQEPLNKVSVEAYTSSFTCSTTHPNCPMHLVLDRRVPTCDAATHMCKLVDST